MAQLVGQRCIQCAEVIRSILDGDFCLRCKKAIHHTCRLPQGETASALCCPVCGGNPAMERIPDFRLGVPKPSKPHFDVIDPIFGGLLRIHRADIWHTTFFYLYAAVLVLSGPICFLAGVDKDFGKIWTSIGVLGGLLVMWAGWRNSRNALELYEQGIRIRFPNGKKECRYTDILDVLIQKASHDGHVLVTGLLIRLYNGEVLKATVIANAEEASETILCRLPSRGS